MQEHPATYAVEALAQQGRQHEQVVVVDPHVVVVRRRLLDQLLRKDLVWACEPVCTWQRSAMGGRPTREALASCLHGDTTVQQKH